MSLEGFRGSRAAAARDGLLLVARDLAYRGERALFSPVLVELVKALDVAAADAVSEVGNAETVCETMDVSPAWDTPREVGLAVGLSARRVRQLCEQQLVTYRRAGARGYLVDVKDVQRYLREKRRAA